jgi:hypothetical protein
LVTGFSLGFFLSLFLIFVKLFPSIPMSEIKEDIVHKEEGM